MYARIIKRTTEKCSLAGRPVKYLFSCNSRDNYIGKQLSSASRARIHKSRGTLVEKYLWNSWQSIGLFPEKRCTSSARSYSSEGDGRNASEDNCIPAKDVAGCDKQKLHRESMIDNVRHSDAHARLGEQDQMEWLHNEKLSAESKLSESPFLPRRERFRNEFMRRIIPWEKITVSWDSFPYYIHETTKKVLVECTASHLKHKKFNEEYGSSLSSSSGRILLQSIPGTELYRERMVRALARDLQVSLLVLESSVLAPYDFGEDCSSESESEEENEGCTSESDVDNEHDASNEEDYTSSGETRTEGTDGEVDLQASVEALKKLIPHNIEEFEKSISGEPENSSEASNPETSEKVTRLLKKGDRVKYKGPSMFIKTHNRILLGKIPTHGGSTDAYTIIRGREMSNGQRGEVYEVNGDQVAIIFDFDVEAKKEEELDAKGAEPAVKSALCWVHAKDIEHDLDAHSHDCYVAMEVLCKVLESRQPLIVYFPDSSQWLSRAVSKSNRKEFVHKLQEMFDQLSGPVVLICGKNKMETGASKEKGGFQVILPALARVAKLPLSLQQFTEGFSGTKRTENYEIYKLFTNVMSVSLPTEDDLLRTFNNQIEEDRIIVISRSNLNELNKVLQEHDLLCMDLLNVKTDGVILTKQSAEKVVGWAKNHHLSSCHVPLVKGDRLQLPRESLELAILRLKEQESVSKKPSHYLKNLAKDEYETNFVSAVVPPGEIGVKFDDVGALEDVKNALNELVILPMRRPELFSHGNLLRPCKGILLFGPPGTGKTLLAKALATEAGANFISITGSALTSKWFGDAEKLTRALFSFASRLAPVIIFVDEVDSLLGARGGSFEHEATRRMRNEFMAAWDGLRSKDSQRIIILGATNRPFDLDDAVIRRLPRRIYVDLPDGGNRIKILKIILSRENLEPGFSFEGLANATDGYSGSDLKNLCIAAAYRPVQELIDDENKGNRFDGAPALRPLNLDDFIASKSKVGPSVAYDAGSMNELRKWNDRYGEGGSRKTSPFGF